MKTLSLLTVSALLLLFVGCQSKGAKSQSDPTGATSAKPVESAPLQKLTKTKTDPRLEGKNWVLTELFGEAITFENENRQASLFFDGETGRLSGSDSCNRIMGGYELLEGERISFGVLASTKMACPDMTTAEQFTNALAKVDSYAISEGVLSLNRARMSPLARFRLQD